MKKTLVTMAVAALTISSFAQGTINILNTLGASPNVLFRAPVYGAQTGDSSQSLSGQSAAGTPAGSTVYTGPLLAGTGYSFAVYYGAATVTDPNALNLLYTTTFRSGGAAGLINTVSDFVVPGIATGAQAALQVRAWDNAGGTLTWDNALIKGSSGLFQSAALGGGITFAPDMTGWTSFNIYGTVVPEPSTFVLAGLGAASLLIFRRRK